MFLKQNRPTRLVVLQAYDERIEAAIAIVEDRLLSVQDDGPERGPSGSSACLLV